MRPPCGLTCLRFGNEHSHFTVTLSCTADSRKLPAFIIAKRKAMSKEVLPPGVVVCINKKGRMDEAMMLEWTRVVWNSRPGALLRLRSMLVLDAFHGHLTDPVKRALGEGKTDQVIRRPPSSRSTLC
ncbi:hypothetical protein HPB51_008156 [Rhipicephalus microplus]|uniref:DDE-1 domain-containing protein n=1 Tax=Rhipicephalus microplus TaxID=6941 RepID=A0A9J6D4J7_RHIMP|nr:hypothetical protein HPB51_008156 [Rhipicephalus microplus]